MAYDINKLAKLEALKTLSQRINSDFATKDALKTVSDKVDTLVTAGGEPNVITAVKVNGTEQTIADKAVNITVPVNTSDLTNDAKFQSETEVSTAIQTAISSSGHAHFTKVDAVPEAASAEENTLYLVMNTTTNHYDIYAKVGAEVVLLDDTTVDLSGYATTEAVNTAMEGKVNASDIATDAEVTEMLNEVFGK